MFTKAVRRKAKLKIAIAGPSGSGKTMGALKIATGMVQELGGRIALIDCENDSASLYADKFDFDAMNLTPPFTTEKYIAAFQEAARLKYTIVIADTISHAWAGTGGLIEQKDKLDSGGKAGFQNWAPITKKHEAFKAGFLQADIHVICNMRSKQDYILFENDKGKQAPRKVGMAPIQRDGMEYEFTTFFEVDMNNQATTNKDRTGMFKEPHQLSEETGLRFVEWLNEATHEALPPEPPPPPPPNKAKQAPPPFTPYKVPEQPLTALEKMELGKFIVPGGPHKGKRLGEVPYNDIMFYRTEKVAEAEQRDDKTMHPVIQDLVNRIDTYYLDFKP